MEYVIQRMEWPRDGKKEIFLAGGCFWGTQDYLDGIPGVVHTSVGYANGRTLNPTYEQVCSHTTGYAEAVQVLYRPDQITLSFLLRLYFTSVDPTAVNRQGGDVGDQYRTGIYYTDPKDSFGVQAEVERLQTTLKEPVAIEVKPLKNYYLAEEEHQHYLRRNPGGYCHIPAARREWAKNARDYKKPDDADLKKLLSPNQYHVTQHGATEPAFRNEYHDHFERGIYVDVTTGQPLFSSGDKFESNCGWPAFARPIYQEDIQEVTDLSGGMVRTEVRSRLSGSHLGHVFDDGPDALGGMRYCVNSASLRFVPEDRMTQEGYGHLLPLLDR